MNIPERITDLKECPFCGEDATGLVKSKKDPENPFYVRLRCLSCDDGFFPDNSKCSEGME